MLEITAAKKKNKDVRRNKFTFCVSQCTVCYIRRRVISSIFFITTLNDAVYSDIATQFIFLLEVDELDCLFFLNKMVHCKWDFNFYTNFLAIAS